jgi:hypothetical protein
MVPKKFILIICVWVWWLSSLLCPVFPYAQSLCWVGSPFFLPFCLLLLCFSPLYYQWGCFPWCLQLPSSLSMVFTLGLAHLLVPNLQPLPLGTGHPFSLLPPPGAPWLLLSALPWSHLSVWLRCAFPIFHLLLERERETETVTGKKRDRSNIRPFGVQMLCWFFLTIMIEWLLYLLGARDKKTKKRDKVLALLKFVF